MCVMMDVFISCTYGGMDFLLELVLSSRKETPYSVRTLFSYLKFDRVNSVSGV